MFQIVGERFDCTTVEKTDDTYVFAAIEAERMSKEHDMDFVILLNEGLPVSKYVDGKVSK